MGIVVLFVAMFLAAASDWASAQTLTWSDQGSYTEMRRINLTSDTARAIWSANDKRPNSSCQAIGGNVWIGTATVTSAVNTVHPNIAYGQIVLASGTAVLGGTYQGALYATADVSLATVTMRCIDNLVR